MSLDIICPGGAFILNGQNLGKALVRGMSRSLPGVIEKVGVLERFRSLPLVALRDRHRSRNYALGVNDLPGQPRGEKDDEADDDQGSVASLHTRPLLDGRRHVQRLTSENLRTPCFMIVVFPDGIGVAFFP
jgi:hypothetical protein